MAYSLSVVSHTEMMFNDTMLLNATSHFLAPTLIPDTEKKH